MLLQIHESVNQVNVALPVLLERETRFELATPALARRCSTAELFPQMVDDDRIELPTSCL